MELPKNTTQIGEVRGSYRVFIEDYVISYLKQLCRQEPDRKKRVAFYGVMRCEEALQYFFIYGGSEVAQHGSDDAYLTGEDYEEITWTGGSWFEEYVPLGFVTLQEEIPEELCLFISGKTVRVQGYHIFYEKNESMLAFLIHRQAQLEEKMQQKTQEVKKAGTQEVTQPAIEAVAASGIQPSVRQTKEPGIFGIVKSAAAALLIVLCVTAISTMNGFGKMESLHHFFQKAFQAMTEKKLPDREEALTVSTENVEETITENVTETIPEHDWAEKMEQENRQTEPPIQEETKEPRFHIIKKGETLISISREYYGDDSQVKAICELNGIANCDTIQIGQKIELP